MRKDLPRPVDGDPEAGSAVRPEEAGAPEPGEVPPVVVAGAVDEDPVEDPVDEIPDPPAGGVPATALPPAGATWLPGGAAAVVGGGGLVLAGAGLLAPGRGVALEPWPPPPAPVIGPRPVWASMKLPLDEAEPGPAGEPPDTADREAPVGAPPGSAGAAGVTPVVPAAADDAGLLGAPAAPGGPLWVTGLDTAGERATSVA